MATLDGELWRHNVAKITLVDVTDDHKLMYDPMPSDFYPVLREVWLPKYKLMERLLSDNLVNGYFYDWHEAPDAAGADEHWYVGVVSASLLGARS